MIDTEIINDVTSAIARERNKSGCKNMEDYLELINKVKKNFEKMKLESTSAKDREELQKKEECTAAIYKKEKHINDVISLELSSDYENLYSTNPITQGVHVDSIQDALIMSLNTLLRVDLEYIQAITGESYKTIIKVLKGSIYQDPETWNECFYKGWVMADEYLSGNLKEKLDAVKKANKKYHGYFNRNLEALLNVMPKDVDTKDIYVTLGSPWIPVNYVQKFVEWIVGCKSQSIFTPIVRHDSFTGTWQIGMKSTWNRTPRCIYTYGTLKKPALSIIEHSLNMSPIAIYDYKTLPSGKTYKEFNEVETSQALNKQQELIKAFRKWLFEMDDVRKEEITKIYNDTFCFFKKRHFDGSFLTLPTLNPEVQLFDYQKNAIARILLSPNVLLAHDVGAGKTFIMIAAGMELKRLGFAKKLMYVVPNNIVGQWKNIFLHMYPNANLLVVEPKTFKPALRKQVLLNIKNNTYDGIIMAYSCFEMIGVSQDFYIEQAQKQLEQIDKIYNNKDDITNKLEKTRKDLLSKLAKLNETYRMTTMPAFDELGIDRLFIDEAHNFKNVPLNSNIGFVLGINNKGSEKCQKMMDKVYAVQKGSKDGGGVVMATGTPITNSVTDAFVFQKYLQNGQLALLGLHTFDLWAANFAEQNTSFEVDVDPNNFRLATRFSKFHNIQELTTLLAGVADFHHVNNESDLPEFNGYKDIEIEKSKALENYLEEISTRVETIRGSYFGCKKEGDNMLKVTVDGRKAALDVRLVDKSAGFDFNSKVEACSTQVANIYFGTSKDKLTQLIFCDTSIPKNGFNIYDELKRLLILKCVPENEIEYIHDADTEKKRNALFEKMRKGDVRILIGSTFKLGLGVNVQDKLIALHHIDVPWRPADMVQREGRIKRPGNQNKEIFIYRYVTKGSFDAYSWQLLESKQSFISELLSGYADNREEDELGDMVLNYAEVKALAVGNPLIKDRVSVQNELCRLQMLNTKFIEKQESMNRELAKLPGEQVELANKIYNLKEDVKRYEECKKELSSTERIAIRELISKHLFDLDAPTEDQVLLTYQGFDVIIPSNNIIDKPYIILSNKGQYTLYVSKELGIIVKMNNLLEGLKGMLDDTLAAYHANEVRKEQILEELKKTNDYSDLIIEAKEKLEELDNKLKV